MLKTSIIGRLSRFARDRRGVSAIEFAFIAPVMIGLYLGCSEISDGVAADRKVSLIAGALSNLSAQTTSITTAQMTNILDASSAIISPYSASLLKMTVSCIKIDGTGVAKIQWSATRNGTARAVGSTYSFPSTATALAVKSSWLLLSEVSYAYTPTVGYTITGTLTLSDQMYMSPRITAPTYGVTTCT
ncbi:MAG TPA: TadE/TadG family type IV pilus assembly protein [Pseudolabrys sp.]|nr:TadE/TadG family type IV pilus assembly protein [Pseudolabrys sp.]